MAQTTSSNGKTALLLMDFQNDIVQMIPEPQRSAVVANAAALQARAREVGMPVFYIVVKFRPGYPEVNPRNKGFTALKGAGRLVEGTNGADIDTRLAPLASEPVITKRRVSGFFNTDLDTVLGAHGVDKLVLSGLVTSGVILSSLRWAADRDYGLTLAADACADSDEEVHRVLTEKVFPRQASVLATSAVLALPEFNAA